MKKILEFVKALFTRVAPKVKSVLSTAINFTNLIKDFDEKNPMLLDFITSVIPGTLDDKILQYWRRDIAQIARYLGISEKIVSSGTFVEIVKGLAAMANELDGVYRKDFLNSLAKLLASSASDGKIDWNDLNYLVEYFYKHKLNKE